jgi:hypothetical protein
MSSHLATVRAVINRIIKIRFKYKEALYSKALRVLGSQERPCVMERGNSDFSLTAVRFSPPSLCTDFHKKKGSRNYEIISDPQPGL